MVRKLFVVGAAVWSLYSAPPARSSILLFDSFDYPNGSLVPHWIHHSGAVTGELQVLLNRALVSQINSEDVSALLQGQPYGPTTNVTLYASFTVNVASLPTGGGTYFAHFKDGGTSTFRDKIFATTNGVPTGFYRVGVGNLTNGPNVVISSNLSPGTDYRLVTRYVISNVVSTLWLNPAAENDPSVTATDSAAAATIVTFALREQDGIGTLFFDDLVVATTFAEVIDLTGPPQILTVPQSQNVSEGSNVSFTVLATGAQPLSYQWRFHGTNLPGATHDSLSLASVTTDASGPYDVVITNLFGNTNSPVATLAVNPVVFPPTITMQPQNQMVPEGSNASFTVTATGSLPLTFQWQFHGTNLIGQTLASLSLPGVTSNQAGPYMVVITNVAGATNSQTAILSVIGPGSESLAYLHYNVKGNGAADWSTNAAQIQAIGRQVMYLNPDVITFNEIPLTFTYEMTNFVATFLPGFYLASNSGSDGFIRSVIVSRFPILLSRSYFSGTNGDLTPFGYTNSDFTRDLFEARIGVPGYPQPLHVFTTHLKSGQGTDESSKRAAEANAISNFFVNGFLTTNALHPYVLSGDLNEDINNPPSSNPQTIQRLVNPATGLHLTTPINPFSGSPLTFSIQNTNGLTRRYDYIMPSSLLFDNIMASQVFRTDLLPNPPPPLSTNDDRTASDHLPVFMVFANPFSKPFRLISIVRSNLSVTLNWESVPGQPYLIETSSNLANWFELAGGLTATGVNLTFTTNSSAGQQFFRVHRLP